MKAKERRFYIPHKRTGDIICRVEEMGQIKEVPIEKAMLKVLARLYRERSMMSDELA